MTGHVCAFCAAHQTKATGRFQRLWQPAWSRRPLYACVRCFADLCTWSMGSASP